MLSVSIVVYKPNIVLLVDVIKSLLVACESAHIVKDQWDLDIINNHNTDNVESRLQESNLWSDIRSKITINFKNAGGNVGYGAGNNLSLLSSNKKYHLVLNPDVILNPESLSIGINYLNENPSIGLLTPKVIGFDNELHYLCKRNPTIFDLFLRSFAPTWLRKLFKHRMDLFEMRDKDYSSTISPVPFPTGCFMLFRTCVVQKIGGFDTSFFMYLEDADIGRRLNEISTSAYLPSMTIKHKWSRGSHNNWKLKFVTIQSALIYWKKWGGFFTPTK